MTTTNIPLELLIDDADGSVTFRLLRSPQQDDYRPHSVRIPEYLRAHPHSTAEAIADALGSTTKNSVSTTLSVLKKEGIVDNGVDGHSTWEWVAVT